MTKSEKKKMLTANASLWPALHSNQLLSKAIGEPSDDPEKPANQ